MILSIPELRKVSCAESKLWRPGTCTPMGVYPAMASNITTQNSRTEGRVSTSHLRLRRVRAVVVVVIRAKPIDLQGCRCTSRIDWTGSAVRAALPGTITDKHQRHVYVRARRVCAYMYLRT